MRSCRTFLPALIALALCLSCGPKPTGGSGGSAPLPSLAYELKQWKAAGLPTKPEELQAPVPPADQNAAPIYRQLVALLKAKPALGDDKIATEFTGRKGLSAKEARQLRRAFQRRADIGQLVHKATSRPQCVFERKWSQGANMQFPEFAKFRVAARWLHAESALQLYDGHPGAAIRTAAQGFVLGRHCAQDPMLIAYLVAIAADSITLTGMEDILYVAGGQVGVARAVHDAISTGWRPHSLAYALRGEAILPLVHVPEMRRGKPENYGRDIKQQSEEFGIGPLPALSPYDRTHFDSFIDRTEVAMLEPLRKLIAVADRRYGESNGTFQLIVSDVQKQTADPAYIVARIVFPGYLESPKAGAVLLAKSATAQTAATILDWKTVHGSFPEKLSDAMQSVPSDPFDGQPLRYKREGKRFVIYSVGRTGKFAGGDMVRKPSGREALFRYPAPIYLK